MAETNSAILDELEKGERKIADAEEAEREKALATYWSILGDASRTGKEDKAAMQDAMKVLGKTLAQADDDSRVIEGIGLLDEARLRLRAAQDASRDADAAALAFQETYKIEVKKLQEQGKQLRLAAIDRRRQHESAGDALTDAHAFLDAHAEAVRNAKRFIK